MRKRARPRITAAALTLLTFGVASSTGRADSPKTDAPPTEQTFGTLIRWTDDWDAARQAARSDNRLLLVLHLSGNFTKSEFT